ncbi:MAG: hypothetical protein H6850_00260 [Alphaproteobacteria bacterium]|nr:MAG: hypothetical protein H6850_00260 [Alphaproteobacteria bacterium]
MSKIFRSLKQDLTELEKQYEANGTVDWATFLSNKEAHQKKVIEIRQEDLDEGTLRVTHPCILRLKEDIQFNPNRAKTWLNKDRQVTSNFSEAVALDPNRELDWFPSHSVPSNIAQYFTGDAANAYRLGFFAAITIEAEGVILDLNGCTLAQSKEHALFQRFFALVELADQPFIMNEGPTDFGHELKSAKKVWIKNGTLGFNSHHCIHGNGAEDILITHVNFENFEVAALSLNGSRRVALVRSHIKGNRKDAPVLALYSAAVFNVRFASALQHLNLLTEEVEVAYLNLKYTVDKIFNDIIFGIRVGRRVIKGHINLNPRHYNLVGQIGDPSLVIFHNKEGVIDGPSYGVLFTAPGAAVGPFFEYKDAPKEAGDFEMLHCCVENITNNPIEVPSLANANGEGNQVGASNEVIQFFNTFDCGFGIRNSDGTYQGTVVSEVQFRLQALKNSLGEEYHKYFGSLNIDEDLVNWALQGDDKLVLMPCENKAVLMKTKKEFLVRYQGDGMHHVIKGFLAIRVEGVENVLLEDISVICIENKAELSCPNMPYSGPKDGGHDGQSAMVGSFNGQIRAIHFSAVDNVTLNKVTVKGARSDYGSVYGIMFQNKCTGMYIRDIIIDGLHAGRRLEHATHAMPNQPQKVHGLVIDSSCKKLHGINNVFVGDALTQPKPHKIEKMCIGLVEEKHHHQY